jgi:RecA-family ATPase
MRNLTTHSFSTRMLDSDSKPSTRRHLIPADGDASPIALPPHSTEAEQSVLGGLLLDNDVAPHVFERLCADDFFSGAHREIFRHIQRVLEDDRPADTITVADSLAGAQKLDYVGGLAYLGALAQNVPTAANAEHYAGIVKERARRRAIMATAAEIGAAAAAPASTATSEAILADASRLLEQLTDDGAARGPSPLDLCAMVAAEVPERRFRVGKIMPMGAPGLWTGHGGAGKTQTALHLACCIALGRNFFGEPVKSDPVAFVSTEDDREDLHYRLAHQIRVLGADMDELAGRLFLYDLTAHDPVIVTAAGDSGVAATKRYAALRAELRRHDVRVVFLDNLATLCAVDVIKPAHATQTFALCSQLVPKDGNAIVIAHVDKATAKAGHSREAYSGTAAFHNRARWRWYLFAPNAGDDADGADDKTDSAAGDDGRRVLEVQKVNAGRSGARIPLRILDNGAIAPDTPDDGIVAAIARRTEREAVLATVVEAETRGMRVPAAKSGPSTAYEVLPAMPSYPDTLRGKAGRRRLLKLLTEMQAAGDVAAREQGSSGRHKREFLFHARVKQ